MSFETSRGTPQNLVGASMFEKIRADMRAYEEDGGWYKNLGFYVGATYRFGYWAHKRESKPARLGLGAMHRVMATPWRLFRNVWLLAPCEIGPGLRIVNPHNVLVAPDASLGANCSLDHAVTLGTGPLPGAPAVGNGVVVSAGAKILGGVRVGDDVFVGDNAVVTKDVPSHVSISVATPRQVARPAHAVGE